jgi:DNA-binding transcriptional MerR regulator
MPPKKTTEAEHRSMRLNPRTSAADAKVLEIIKKWEAQGFNFKQIASDAILRAEGIRPETFNDPALKDQQLLGQIEDMLARFADDLIKQIGSRSQGTRADEEDDGDDGPEEQPVSKFARNFAKGFLQRQQSGE